MLACSFGTKRVIVQDKYVSALSLPPSITCLVPKEHTVIYSLQSFLGFVSIVI